MGEIDDEIATLKAKVKSMKRNIKRLKELNKVPACLSSIEWWKLKAGSPHV